MKEQILFMGFDYRYTGNSRYLFENMINNNKIKYIYVIANEENNSTVQKLIDETNVETQEWNTLSNLTEIQRTENENYFTIMNANLELLKNELYK